MRDADGPAAVLLVDDRGELPLAAARDVADLLVQPGVAVLVQEGADGAHCTVGSVGLLGLLVLALQELGETGLGSGDEAGARHTVGRGLFVRGARWFDTAARPH